MSKRLFLLSFSYSLSFSAVIASSEECTDLHGRTIAPGLHYVPGPDACTLCVCDSGSPKWCKAVLCSPPQDCKSFRLGQSCCEFICLDDTFHKTSSDGNGHNGNTDLGLRLIASAVTAILSLSLLFFLIHRLRQRKIRGRQNRQLSEDERSLGSIGYIAGSLAYLPDSMGYLGAGSQDHHLEFHYEEPPAHYPLWKPPGNYFPRGEAPPPYEEAVAAARAEAALAAAVASNNNTLPMHRTIPLANTLPVHRTIPINLATSGNFHLEPEPQPQVTLQPRSSVVEDEGAVAAIRSDVFYEDVVIGPPTTLTPVESFNPNVTVVVGKNKTTVNIVSVPIPASELMEVAVVPRPRLNDLNKGSQDSSSSYQCLPHQDDNDDYRSECENCKSTHGSCYYLDEESGSPQETMTLHRRPQDTEEQAYYRTSLTLPTHSRRLRSTPLHGTPAASLHGARENWFSSMPMSSTSSSEEE